MGCDGNGLEVGAPNVPAGVVAPLLVGANGFPGAEASGKGLAPVFPKLKLNGELVAAGVVPGFGVTVVPPKENEGAVEAAGLDSRDGLLSSIIASSCGGGVAGLIGEDVGAGAGTPKVKVVGVFEVGVAAGAKIDGPSALVGVPKEKLGGASFLTALLKENDGAEGALDDELTPPKRAGFTPASSPAGELADVGVAGLKEKVGGGAPLEAGALVSGAVAGFPKEKSGGAEEAGVGVALGSVKENEGADGADGAGLGALGGSATLA